MTTGRSGRPSIVHVVEVHVDFLSGGARDEAESPAVTLDRFGHLNVDRFFCVESPLRSAGQAVEIREVA
jgi:hypothetical protein